MCVSFTISLTLGEAVTATEFELLQTKKSMNGVYKKTNIDCFFISGMV